MAKFQNLEWEGVADVNYWGQDDEQRNGRYIFINENPLRGTNTTTRSSRCRMREFRLGATNYNSVRQGIRSEGIMGILDKIEYKINTIVPRNDEHNAVADRIYWQGKVTAGNTVVGYLVEPIFQHSTTNGLTATDEDQKESTAAHIVGQDGNRIDERLFEGIYSLRTSEGNSWYDTTGTDPYATEANNAAYDSDDDDHFPNNWPKATFPGTADTKTTFVYQTGGDADDIRRRDNVLEHQIPVQIGFLKTWAQEKRGRAQKIASKILPLVNLVCDKLFEDDHAFVFDAPNALQEKVTTTQCAASSTRTNTIRLLPKENVCLYLENLDGSLNTTGYFKPDEFEEDQEEDFTGDIQPNRIIQFTIVDAEDRVALNSSNNFEPGRFVRFQQVGHDKWYSAEILNWNRRILETNGDKTDTFLLTMYMKGGKTELTSFTTDFKTTVLHDGNRPGARQPEFAVRYVFAHSVETIAGQLEIQAVKESKVVGGVPFKLFAGDYVRSVRPNLDSMSYFSSLSVTADSGILFKGTAIPNSSRPVLLNLPVENPFSVSSDASFKVNGVSLTPKGDIYYSTSEPRLHQMTTNIPLRHARLFLEMQPRDSEIPVRCKLAPRGQFEIMLGFWKRT